MPLAAVPFLVGSSIAAGGSIAGAAIGAHASGKAADLQKAAEDKSLALQQQQYQDAQTRYAPYQQVGQSVLPTLRNLAANVQAPRYGQSLSGLSIYGSPQQNAPSGSGQPQMGTPGGGSVMMRAPNGQTKAVPREQVAHYQQQGAQVVQ